MNEAPLTSSVLPWKNRVMQNKDYHGVIQSNNAVFASFKYLRFCCTGDCFVIKLFWK